MRRRDIDRFAKMADELDHIDHQILMLGGLAESVLSMGFKCIDVTLETLPKNGARPIINPLYPPGNYTPSPLDEENKPPQPVGYQKYYIASELDPKEGSISVMLEMDDKVVMSMIDTALIRLKNKRDEIYRDSNKIVKAPK